VNTAELTALIVAVTGLIGALGALFVQLRQLHGLVNGRMTQLLEQTKIASASAGELVGRDYQASSETAAPSAEAQTSPPTGTLDTSIADTGTPNHSATTPAS